MLELSSQANEMKRTDSLTKSEERSLLISAQLQHGLSELCQMKFETTESKRLGAAGPGEDHTFCLNSGHVSNGKLSLSFSLHPLCSSPLLEVTDEIFAQFFCIFCARDTHGPSLEIYLRGGVRLAGSKKT